MQAGWCRRPFRSTGTAGRADPFAPRRVVAPLAPEHALRHSRPRRPPPRFSGPALVTNARHPIWLPAATQPGAWTFAILFSVESISRASLASIVPIQAYDLLQDEQQVSFLYFAIGMAGIVATLFAPVFIRHIPRRFVYTGGAVMLIVACVLLATFTLEGQSAGMFLRIIGANLLSITLNLYIMDFIPKQQFVRSESLRLTLSTMSWAIGPGFGVFLYVRFGHIAPYVWSGFWALALIALFWWLRLSGSVAVRPGTLRPTNPVASIRRFIAQPRMRIAWLIAFGRSCYWSTFFIYAPILMVATGQAKLSGGVIVSIGNALLLFAVWWGRLGSRVGVRAVAAFSFVGVAVLSLLAALAGEAHPWIAALLLLAGANFAVALDAVGSTPFLRAVHVYERPQMTAVYRTYLDVSELLPPLIYAIILGFTGLGGVFAALGVFSAICGGIVWRYLPRSM